LEVLQGNFGRNRRLITPTQRFVFCQSGGKPGGKISPSEEYSVSMNLTPYGVAARLGVPRTRIKRLARGKTLVTADTALRLGKFFGTTPAIQMNAQAQFDLETARGQYLAAD
jgi:addiction module HigA family antidote